MARLDDAFLLRLCNPSPPALRSRPDPAFGVQDRFGPNLTAQQCASAMGMPNLMRLSSEGVEGEILDDKDRKNNTA